MHWKPLNVSIGNVGNNWDYFVRLREVRWGEVRWGEVRWGEVRWGEVRWGEVRWGEAKVRLGYVPGPHDGRLLDVLWPDPCTPVPDGQEVLGEARIALEGVHGAEVRVIDGGDALVRGLGLLVAEKDTT